MYSENRCKHMKHLALFVLVLSLPALASADTTQTSTASAYGRTGCRAALLNVSRVSDNSGLHTWASYTVWRCAPGATNPEEVIAQQSVLILDNQFVVGQGGQPWSIILITNDGSATITWTPDGRVHSTYDATWTSSIAGQMPTKTTKSLTTDSAPPTGTLFGVTPDAVSGTIMRGQDVTK